MSLGENIKARREKLGLTQEALAGACGFTKQNVCQYETCVRLPNAYAFAAIAKVLGVTMESLIYGEERKEK